MTTSLCICCGDLGQDTLNCSYKVRGEEEINTRPSSYHVISYRIALPIIIAICEGAGEENLGII